MDNTGCTEFYEDHYESAVYVIISKIHLIQLSSNDEVTVGLSCNHST